MKTLRFIVSLTTNENDYQIEQAAAAEKAARRLGVEIQVIYAENDAITQSQQILSRRQKLAYIDFAGLAVVCYFHNESIIQID